MNSGVFKNNLRRNQKGQALTEYAILVGLVAIASVAAMAFFGAALRGRIASLVSVIAGDSTENVDRAERSAKAASEALRNRLGEVDGMTVQTGSNGEVLDKATLGGN
jgi:pilus assembly protein Flp/PilA